MEPVVILEKMVLPREMNTKPEPHSLGPRTRRRRKNRRLLFCNTKTKHIVKKLFEPAYSEHFPGFTKDDGAPAADFFCGFSDHEISFSMTQRSLHPLHGFDDEIHQCIKRVYSIGEKFPYEHIMTVHPIYKKKIRVLSLFEGVGTGLLVLQNKLNLDIECYYSCETSHDALLVLRNKMPGQLIHLGNVQKLQGSLLHSLGRIDLLIGGPPCSEVSLVNARRKGLSDPTSASSLYRAYLRIRDYLIDQAYTHSYVFFYLMEMTYSLEKTDYETMNRDVGHKPFVSNARVFLPAERKRLFWTNVPQTETSQSPVPIIDDLLCPGRKAKFSACKTITSNPANQIKGGSDPVLGTSGPENFYVLELERLMGLPDNHTAVGNLSISKRRKLIGKLIFLKQRKMHLRKPDKPRKPLEMV